MLPRDPLLYARLCAIVGALILLALGVQVLAPFLELAILAVLGSSAVTWRASLARGGAPVPLREIPPAAIALDLFAAAAWMLARALDERGVTFVLVIAVGVLAMYRAGRAGLFLTIGTYVIARAAQEMLRVLAGTPTPTTTLIGDTVVVAIALAILSASVDANRRAEARSQHALARARSLERSRARELGHPQQAGGALAR